jgi:uncharacterized protein YecE (DUF72 family)
MSMAIYIGTSGWSYDHWEGVLYPHRSSSKQRLAHYVARYNTVEVNNSFYRWPSHVNFSSWKEQVPPDFRMTIKASRALSHSKRLKEPEAWTERMVEGVAHLQDRMGVFLVQLHPHFASDLDRLDYFLQQVPPRLQTAIEFRHPSWHHDEVFALLEKHNAGLLHHERSQSSCVLRTTAPFVYLRLHGPDEHHLYAGSYSDDDLKWWANHIQAWHASGKEVWAYFNNDPYGNAVRNADTLKSLLGV